jgi:26S proteasome non-ATPase regulatory subunit 9
MVKYFHNTIEDETDSNEAGVMLKAQFDDLVRNRDNKEKELDRIAESLNSETFAHIGLQKPLIDPEGFPVSGIDLLEVRKLRSRYIALTNDLRSISDQIECTLHLVHETARMTGTITQGDSKERIPFGRVDSIVSGSAADVCGMLVGDKVVRFGPLSCLSVAHVNNCYESIPNIVRGLSVNETLEVYVIRPGRENEELLLQIAPQGGRIGCLINRV